MVYRYSYYLYVHCTLVSYVRTTEYEYIRVYEYIELY